MSDEEQKSPQGVIVRPAEYEAETNIGKWEVWYEKLDPSAPPKKYGDPATYRLAAAFLSGCREIEDWGCGRGGFRPYSPGRYIGVDGSKSPFADRIAELTTYRSRVDGILLRHVLEHNYNWPKVLDGAVKSFRKRLCVVLFTPFADTTRELRHNRKSGVDVPDLSLSTSEIEAHFEGLNWRLDRDIVSKSQYGVEHVYYVWRPEPTSFWGRLRALFGG